MNGKKVEYNPGDCDKFNGVNGLCAVLKQAKLCKWTAGTSGAPGTCEKVTPPVSEKKVFCFFEKGGKIVDLAFNGLVWNSNTYVCEFDGDRCGCNPSLVES